MDVHAASCTLAVISERKKKLRFRQCSITRIPLSNAEAWRKTPALGKLVAVGCGTFGT
jgi:hypothetical protein